MKADAQEKKTAVCWINCLQGKLVFPTSISETKPPAPSLLEGQEQMTIEGLGVEGEGETKCSRLPGGHTMVIPDSHL